MEIETKIFIGVFAIAVLVSASFSGSAVDFGNVHCDYLQIIDGFQCSDYNEWYAPTGEVTQQMRDYYEGFLGLTYSSPPLTKETWTVSNMSP